METSVDQRDGTAGVADGLFEPEHLFCLPFPGVDGLGSVFCEPVCFPGWCEGDYGYEGEDWARDVCSQGGFG